MPDYSALITIELEAELEFEEGSLDKAIDWLRESNPQDLTELSKGKCSKKNISILSIKEIFNGKK